MPVYPLHVAQNLADATVDMTIDRIGRGGFSEVLIGPDRKQGGEIIALKTLQERFSENFKIRQMFIEEALTWMGLWDHVNILDAQFVSKIDSVPFLHLDYAEKGTLRDVMRSLPQIPLETRLWWAQHIAAGLAYLHTDDEQCLHYPLVHRDLKPENILLLSNNVAQISDFGLSVIASLDEEMMTIGDEERIAVPSSIYSYKGEQRRGTGTPQYMAPEQWLHPGEPEQIHPAADIYAFGLILCELVTGMPAYFDAIQDHLLADWRKAHLTGKPRSLRSVQPTIPETIEKIYEQCLKKSEQNAHQFNGFSRSVAYAIV